MLPYNASDMLRAIQQDNGLTVVDAEEPARPSRGRQDRGGFRRFRINRWLGTIAAHIGIL